LKGPPKWGFGVISGIGAKIFGGKVHSYSELRVFSCFVADIFDILSPADPRLKKYIPGSYGSAAPAPTDWCIVLNPDSSLGSLLVEVKRLGGGLRSLSTI